MKNKIIFSIVDDGGTKQFHLHRIAKKIILYGILGFLILLVGGFFLMNYLMSQVKEIDLIKTEMINRYRQVYMQNQDLKERINAKTLELIDVGQKIDDLEEIIEFSKNKDKTLENETVLVELDTKDQMFLLQIIPSGHPLKEFKKIQPIKERIHPLKNKYGVNSGIDYLVSSGTPIYATADGIIESSREKTSPRGYGKFIKITHAYGFASMYGHLSQVLVKKGEFVRKGQVIGYSGQSGSSNGERLYYEVRFLGSYQDALTFAQWDNDHFESIFQQDGRIDWNRLLWALEDLKTLMTYQERIN